MAATVYIPTWNGGERLLTALASLEAQTKRPSVVVIDNGSTDGSPALVRDHFPHVAVVGLGENRGFARAVNEGVRRHPSERILLLNDDTECEPRFVEALEAELGAGVGMVAAVLLQRAEPSLVDSAGVVVDRTLLAFDYLHGEPAARVADAPPALGPTGGAGLYSREAWEAVGGLDERFFLYLEDVDLALRMRATGVTCRLAAEARALHRHSAALGSGSALKNRHMGWGRGYILRRYGVLGEPRRAARALAGEVVICAGQLVIDRNASGVRGRLDGWRAAKGLPALPSPSGGLFDVSLREALARRLSRRRPRAIAPAERDVPPPGA